MKRKAIAAVLLAAAILSGCSERNESAPNNVAVNSAVTIPSNSNAAEPAAPAPASSSSHTGAPSVIAPSFTDTSSDEPSVSPPEVITPAYNDRNVIDHDITVEYGSAMLVESGEVLELAADVTVQPSASIIVCDGAELWVHRNIKLEGDIELQGSGKLVMVYEDSLIVGSGNVIVGNDFSQIDCGCATIEAHIVPPEPVVKNGATYVGGIVIANKAITLPPEFGSHLAYDSAEPEVREALQKMNADSPYYYTVVSGYRDYWSQQAIFQRYCDRDGYEEAVTYSAKQGHSEHQTGYTMDLDSLYESYADTPEGKWLAANCWKYGFIIRYPKGKEDITGYTYEPWHVRWIGTSTAKLVYDSGLTLEEFLNVEGGWTIID